MEDGVQHELKQEALNLVNSMAGTADLICVQMADLSVLLMAGIVRRINEMSNDELLNFIARVKEIKESD